MEIPLCCTYFSIRVVPDRWMVDIRDIRNGIVHQWPVFDAWHASLGLQWYLRRWMALFLLQFSLDLDGATGLLFGRWRAIHNEDRSFFNSLDFAICKGRIFQHIWSFLPGPWSFSHYISQSSNSSLLNCTHHKSQSSLYYRTEPLLQNSFKDKHSQCDPDISSSYLSATRSQLHISSNPIFSYEIRPSQKIP